MGADDLYRFKSFGPAPPRKPIRLQHLEKLQERRAALRQTPGPSPAENLTPTPGNVLIDDKHVLLGEWIYQMVNEGRAAVGMLRAGKKPEEVRKRQPRFFTEVLDLLPEKDRDSFYSDARRGMSVPQLLRLIGQVQNMSGARADWYRKQYRKWRKETGPK